MLIMQAQDRYLESQHALHRVSAIEAIDAVGSYAARLLAETRNRLSAFHVITTQLFCRLFKYKMWQKRTGLMTTNHAMKGQPWHKAQDLL